MSIPARDRLLLAGAELLEGAGEQSVSTRAICERAGVQAPSLYHHFGNKQGLLEAVVSHGFREFLAAGPVGSDGGDPLGAVREGWDAHVRFGVEHPAFYSYIYGRPRRGERCGVVSDVEAMILGTLEPLASQGRLSVPAADAAAQILAASSGVTLALIMSSGEVSDWSMSARVRDAVLRSVTASVTPDPVREGTSIASAAAVLSDVLARDPGEADVLGRHETALLREWLGRLAASAQR
ncbi:hypothetical protein AN219_12300 [Streptomyces nanshensis]|nr:hypothetical protein AN219_12300 [Streptomyces nanshensis]